MLFIGYSSEILNAVAIYTMVEDEINTIVNEPDEAFIKELEKRSKSFAEGKSKTYTWEETKKAAIKQRYIYFQSYASLGF